MFLILDNLRVHHDKTVKALLLGRRDKIKVFYLLGYSPELNPEECLNTGLKQAIGKKVPVRTKAKLRATREQHMVKLEQYPERIRRFFLDKKTNGSSMQLKTSKGRINNLKKAGASLRLWKIINRSPSR